MAEVENITDPAEKAIKKNEFNPRVLRIKNNFSEKIPPNLFPFSEMTVSLIIKTTLLSAQYHQKPKTFDHSVLLTF